MKKLKIVGVATSIRSRYDEEKLKQAIMRCAHREDLEYLIERMSFNKQVSNSEACLMASLYGAFQEGADIEIIRLNKYFPVRYPGSIPRGKKAGLLKGLRDADGFIISTPVYFGDGNSYAHSFIDFLHENRLIKNRIVGVDSVGAKRNGGQETTNIFILWKALKNGAFICSNGPKTSQYGGTAWAGDLGSIREDMLGIDTSIGVGHRVAQVADLVGKAREGEEDRVNISFWITKDRKSMVEKNIGRTIRRLKKSFPSEVHFEVLNITKLNLKRCIGCSVCPYYFDRADKYGIFKDRIQDDDMKKIYEKLISTDAVVVAGINPRDTQGVADVYQVFVERTRQIRRDNFILTNVPVVSYSVEELGQSNPYALKVMASFLRHNMVILPPIEQYYMDNKMLNDPYTAFEDFVRLAIHFRKGRSRVSLRDVDYVPVGYKA